MTARTRRNRSLAPPQSLEPRLALAGLVQFTDIDGDLVRVASSRGTNQQLAAAIQFAKAPTGAVAGSRTIESIDLSGPVFSGTSLSISVPTTPGGGDGRVDIGRITVGPDGVSAVGIDGSFSSLIAYGSVGRVVVRGSLHAGSTIRSDRWISEIVISGSIEGTAAAPVVIAARGDEQGLALGHVTVGGDSSYGRILAGYDTALVAANGAAQIESVVIGGTMVGTDIVAGIASSNGLDFGDVSDRGIDRSDRSRIGSVRIGGVISTQDSTDSYAIAANAVGSVSVGGGRVTLPANWQSQPVGTTDLIISDIAPTATPYTDFVADAIRAMERRTGSDTSEGILWNVTDGNALPGLGTDEAPWVIRTQDAWGNTQPHDSSAVQQHMLDTISDIIAGAKHVVDISSLAHLADGGFLEAIKKGAQRADAAGNRPVIRLLWGRADSFFPIADGNALLEKFQKEVQAAAPNLIVVATLMADFSLDPVKVSWNHSKIVAADGEVAFVGGINMWADQYLQEKNPITDVGVVVRGPAAADSQKFLDVLWRYAYADSLPLRLGDLWQTRIIATPDIDLTKYLSIAPERGPAVGDVRVMAVGRAAYIADQFIAADRVSGRNIDNPVSAADQKVANFWLTSTPMNGPTTFPGRNTWDGNNPSDTALRSLIDSAQTSVVISQQSMEFSQPVLNTPCYDVRLFDALARKVRDGVSVTIIVSAENRADYRGRPDWTTDVMLSRLTTLTGSRAAAVAAASRSLLVAPFRYSDAAQWPGTNEGPGLHNKVIQVDNRAIYVGSQNAYPDEQQEFGYIIEDRAAVADFNRVYLGPSVYYSTAALIPAPYVVTTNANAGIGSLRQALIDANQHPGPDRIQFNIAAGSKAITLATPLPTVTDPVVIDGLSQAGVSIVGLRMQGASDGFSFAAAAAQSSVTGLTITGFKGSGVFVAAAGITVQANTLVGNGRGLTLAAVAGGLIGGPQAADSNTIRANAVGLFAGAACDGTVVQGNLVTRNTTGVFLAHVTGLSLGTATAGNTISLNAVAGVFATGGLAGTTVQNNTIDGNGRFGVQLAAATGLLLGGSGVSAGNRIRSAANRMAQAVGVYASGGGTGTVVQGNIIAGFVGSGVVLEGVRGITLGGASPSAGNMVQDNGGFGLRASGDCTGSLVQGNTIQRNRLGNLNVRAARGLSVV